MQDIYFIMVIAMFGLAITDLVVGVSNDAVNFLSSAVGSKVASIRTIMIVASLGIFIGATFSSGMMEVARKGIFYPQEFMFKDIMIMFMAVMITDIILLDMFNSLGLPTSTTVSIVFELLGTAVCVSLLKISSSGESIAELGKYINSDKALAIISGILLAVVVSFIVGLIIMWISRYIFSFQYEKRAKYFGAIFGGFAISAITYFILIKGAKGSSLISKENYQLIKDNTWTILMVSFVAFTVVTQLLTSLFKINIFKVIVLIGTFALAMAFAGNDLVNFIGVPLAAMDSYDLFTQTGDADMLMVSLTEPVKTPTLYLLIAGGIMVLTLWTSKKARRVLSTSVDLSRQEEGTEKFEPNRLSKVLVRFAVKSSKVLSKSLPDSFIKKVESRFDRNGVDAAIAEEDAPAFDLIRASVNVVVAAILISIGTSYKLPLSTTYVSFMVAMGASLADRAWGRESAVYRVAGVVNVIAGWFVTAFAAFTTSAIFAAFIYFVGTPAIVLLVILGVVLIYRSSKRQKEADRKAEKAAEINREARTNISEIIDESSDNIAKTFKESKKIMAEVIDGLENHDRAILKSARKKVRKLEKESVALKGSVFHFIKSLDENTVETSRFYILIMDYLTDMTKSLSYIANSSFVHVDNNHKELKSVQINELKEIEKGIFAIMEGLESAFQNKDFTTISELLEQKRALKRELNGTIEKQIGRIRKQSSSPRNTNLFFGILSESKKLTSAAINLISLTHEFYISRRVNDDE